uniref:Uncharacterized protein n=1 Tax=Brassica campestris TaxID=3711 RepID=M4FFP8_BRACM
MAKAGGGGGITNAVNVGIAVQADWENREFISHISLNVQVSTAAANPSLFAK